ncbi:hypothetical protein [Fulvivirga sp.]|uniref:hypothetical protein n=1 Tax=Fulvivirga sp. TaxID=1931237 RepID=UPI0032ECE3B4
MIQIFNHEYPKEKLSFHGVYTFVTSENSIEPLPYGHTLNSTLKFNLTREVRSIDKNLSWLTPRLQKHLKKEPTKKVQISVLNKSSLPEALIINCLDYCYGHSLDKVFNTQRYFNQLDKLAPIVIIHESMVHLINKLKCEVWVVHNEFSDLDGYLNGFDEFVKNESARFKKVFWSKLPMEIDYSTLLLKNFIQTEPFPFESLFKSNITITLILREDRFMFLNWFNLFVYLVSRKLRVNTLFKSYFIFIQNSGVNRLVKKLLKFSPDIKVQAIGLGKSGTLSRGIIDLRQDYEQYKDNEPERISHLSKTDLVIGIHGSHMIIPSAIAGSFINLTPSFKIESYTQDFIPRYKSGQLQAYLGRFIPNDLKSAQLHVEHMIGYIDSMHKVSL